MTIGEKIREARRAANLTQKQLGELCGIAEPTIRRYELGKLNPKIQTLQKIFQALNANVIDVYSDILQTVHVQSPNEHFNSICPVTPLEKYFYEIDTTLSNLEDYKSTLENQIAQLNVSPIAQLESIYAPLSVSTDEGAASLMAKFEMAEKAICLFSDAKNIFANFLESREKYSSFLTLHTSELDDMRLIDIIADAKEFSEQAAQVSSSND